MPDERRLRGISGQRVVRALRKAGWAESERSGKHLALEYAERPGVRITVPTHGGRELPVKTVLAIIRQAGLTREEFEALL